MPSTRCREGDVVFVRAVVLQAAEGLFEVRVEDRASIGVTIWVPARELARAEDIGLLKPINHGPLKPGRFGPR
jgi:hypothetical protein